MANTKVRVLYASAFAAAGVDVEGKDEVAVAEDLAQALIAQGYAELVKPKAAK